MDSLPPALIESDIPIEAKSSDILDIYEASVPAVEMEEGVILGTADLITVEPALDSVPVEPQLMTLSAAADALSVTTVDRDAVVLQRKISFLTGMLENLESRRLAPKDTNARE